jgi:hypothetical protein
MTSDVRALALSRNRNSRTHYVVVVAVNSARRCASYQKKNLQHDVETTSKRHCGSVNGLPLGDGEGSGFALVAGVGCAGAGAVGFADGDGETSCRCGLCECVGAVGTNEGASDGE